MPVAKDVANLRVYSEPSVAAHYASLDQLTACERLLFAKYIHPGMDILDLGVGGGRTTPYLSSVASHYLGMDYSEQMIGICRDKFPQLEFLVADAADLSEVQDSSFDVIVIAFNGLDYMVVPQERRERCLLECFRVLRPGGRLIFSSHNPRAILVRPGWSKERLRAFVAKLVGGGSRWVDTATSILAPAKALHSLVRAMMHSVIRIGKRVTKPVFWRGEGDALDPAHGGLLTHYWLPARARGVLSQFGFDLLDCVGDDFPRTSHLLITDWYYYVFSRNKTSGSAKHCV